LANYLGSSSKIKQSNLSAEETLSESKMSVRSNFSSYSVASQIKVIELKKEKEDLRRELAQMKKTSSQSQSSEAPAQRQALEISYDTYSLPQKGPSTSRGGRGDRGSHGMCGGLKRSITSPDSKTLAKRSDVKTSPTTRRKFWDNDSDPILVDLASFEVAEADLLIQGKSWTEPKCSLENDGAIRQTREIEIRALNGRPYRGSMCP
jgi:hypothetical protein